MRLIKLKLIYVLLIILLVASLNIYSTTDSRATNIALGKSVVPSAEFSADFPAQNAVDGDINTAWGSGLISSGGQWIYVDLGATEKINGFGLKWFNPFYATKYQVYISTDGKTWHLVFNEKNGNGGDDIIIAGPGVFANARFMGILLNGGNDAAYGLREFEVYKYEEPATPTPTVTATPVVTPVITPTPNDSIVLNGDFSTGLDPWAVYFASPASGNSTVLDGELNVLITTAGNDPWSIQVVQNDLTINKGEEYLLAFDARAASPRTIGALVGMTASPWTSYFHESAINITTTMTRYEFRFTMINDTDTKAMLEFELGKDAANVYFDNIVLRSTSGDPSPTPFVTPTPNGQIKVLAGLRQTTYGIGTPFPDPDWWMTVGNSMASKFDGGAPCFIWTVGEIKFSQTNGKDDCHLNFPPPAGASYPNITFSATDINAPYFDAFERAGVRVWLQIEPGDADLDTVIKLILDRYAVRPCVIGVGIDVEWNKNSVDYEGVGIPDVDAQRYSELVRSYKPYYRLFLKHWLTAKMPATYREGITFFFDGMGFPSKEKLMTDFIKWSNFYSQYPVGFQYGYLQDEAWWSSLPDPPGDIGNEILNNCPNTTDLYWVDFSAHKIPW